ncbi:ROK family protein [Cetobacterium sp.]|uniref:ROK family protein n=1 Tax=Cetobacterium sp. TaxID=2071632 RepID=UPI003EE702C5
MKVISIDIGGTEIKYGLISKEGEILYSAMVETEATKGIENLLEKLYKIIDELNSKDILGIGISATGQIDSENGKVVGGTDIIPGWVGTNLVEILEKKYQLPVTIDNDVNCAALGELWKGAGLGKDNFLCLTIGTGIGGGIVIEKNLLKGESNIAGEFGHMRICVDGSSKIYQDYASTTALIRLVFEKTGKKLNGKQIFEEVNKKNEEYISIVEKWIDYFTDGLVNLIYIFNPRLIIIGGGVSKQGDYLKKLIEISLETKVMKNYLALLDIKMAEKGNEAGMLGAGYIILKKICNYNIKMIY